MFVVAGHPNPAGKAARSRLARDVAAVMETALLDYGARLVEPLIDPRKRVFIGYLASAGLIAFAVLALRERTDRGLGAAEALRAIFSKSAWCSSSARADYTVMAANKAVMMAASPWLLTHVALATVLFEWLHGAFGGRPELWIGAPGWAIALAFTTCQFLADDASKYVAHRLLHRWPVLWAFHKVHHSAESLNPLTVYRAHPVEGVVFATRAALSRGAVIGTFVFFFADRVDLATVLGANVFLFLFNATGSNLRHSHVWIPYWPWLERILISPAQHQIHHSRDVRHHDANFGAVLAIWDCLGGTLHLSRGQEGFSVGLSGSEARSPHLLKTLYLSPFVEAASAAANGVSRLLKKWKEGAMRSVTRGGPRKGVLPAFAALWFGFAPHAADAVEELHIYSHRQQFLIQPFIDAFTEKTGVPVTTVFASKGLAQRLQAEGRRSPADLVLTVDIGRLAVYADKDLLAPVVSDALTRNIPAHLRDPGNRWFGFSKRARIIAVAKGRVRKSDIARIEDLADPEWKGRICSRPGSHVYNRALMASLIAAHGEAKAEEWARGFVTNLARRPQGNDRAQVKAIYQGECDIAVINNYYFGKLRASDNPEHKAWAGAVEVVFPNQTDRGSHVNISGGGVARHSRNKELAVAFMEFLTEETAQKLYGEINYEYPVNPDVASAEAIRGWGDFKEDRLPIVRIAELAPVAQKVIDRVGW